MGRVVVTGLGLVTPIGLDTNSSWQQALEGRSGIAPITQFDPSSLDVGIAGEVKNYSPAQCMDAKATKKLPLFIQYGVSATEEALTDAGLLNHSIPEDIGCSIGVGIGGMEFTFDNCQTMINKGARRISPFFVPYILPNMTAGIVSTYFRLQGPNLCTTTACASGTHAIGEAFLHIKTGMCKAMVCGGSESVVNTMSIGGFASMKALSRESADPQSASRPFDKDRNGFVMGEGSGVLVLEDFDHAQARGAKIYAELVGYGMSGDAHHITAPPPEGRGAQHCMKMALRHGQVEPSQVDYINAHGTSTHYNDLYESQAINKVFGDHTKKLSVSSTKGVTGHCLGAAGGIEAVFLAKSIQQQIVPPTANVHNQDPECQIDCTPLVAREREIQYGLSNSFGFGGTNSSILMRKI